MRWAGDSLVDMPRRYGIENHQIRVDAAHSARRGTDMNMMDAADARENGMQRPQSMLQERLGPRVENELLDAAVGDVERGRRPFLQVAAHGARHVHDLRAMGCRRPLYRQPEHETLQVFAKLKQRALADQIDGGDAHAITVVNVDQYVRRQPTDRLVDGRAAAAGHGLQILHRQDGAGLQVAFDDELLGALVCDLDQIHLGAAGCIVSRLSLLVRLPLLALRYADNSSDRWRSVTYQRIFQ